MNNFIRKSTTPFGALVIAALLLIVSAVVILSNVTRAEGVDDLSGKNGRLVRIHDRGEEKVVLTQGATVGDALSDAGIVVDAKDAVEPAIDSKLIASDYQVNIYRARPVIIVDGSVRTKIVTPYQTASQIAESAGIQLFDEDIATLDITKDIINEGTGLKLTINRATPFTFTLYGNTSVVRTQAETVGNMLEEKGIKLGVDDRTSLPKTTQITEGLAVRVWREGKQTVTVDEAIRFETEIVEDVDREISYRAIKTAGVEGSRNVTYEIMIQDDKEVSRKEIASLTTKHPKTQIEVVGVKGKYTTPSENENITWDFLISNGYSRVQAAGIMGNLMQEHRFRTDGDGLAQWIGGRRDELYSRQAPNNIYTQLDFLLYELTGKYSGTNNRIKASNSLVEVVQIFQNEFERCGICMESNRIEYARNILASH